MRGLQIAKISCLLLLSVQLDQRGKIRHARLDGRCLLDATGCCAVNRFPCQIPAHGNLRSVELHIVRRVDLAQHADGAAGIERDERTAILDGIEMILSGRSFIKNAFQRFIIRFAGQGCRSRCHDIEGPRIDDATLADGHALGAQEEEIAADRAVPDGIDRAVDVDARVDEVQEIPGIDCLALLVEVQIGDIIGIQLEFREFIDGNIAVEFLGIDVVDATLRRYRLVIDVFDLRSIHRRGAHHESCCHQGREDLIGQPIRFGAGHAGRILGACTLILSIRITCITHDDYLLLDGLAVRTGC